jgi:citrate synthase
MKTLKEKLFEKIEEMRPRTTNLLKNHSDVIVGNVTIGQAIGGMRGVKSLVTDISYLDPDEGIRFRGIKLLDAIKQLPKVPGGEMPYVEGLVYLLLTGEIPTKEEIEVVADEFNERKNVPKYVFDVIDAMPMDSHPMAMFSASIMSMQKESIFVKEYNKGINKLNYWDPTFEDGLNLLARLPQIAAYIYRRKYKDGDIIPSDPKLDMGGNFAHMMGIDAPYDDVARLYFIIHSDHESGNASAHAGHLVGSTLSDLYFSISSAINALAGPLHGLANQEVLRWLQRVMGEMKGARPTEEIMKKFVWDTLNSGQVIPGFGHAVLRKTDPRYEAQREFCIKHLPNDPIFEYVDILYKVVPPILQEQGKAKNPWPNVDAQSGVIQWHYGLREYDFYTVLFGIGRAIGIVSNIIWDRALLYPLERPKSLTTSMLEEIVKKAK